MRTLRLLLFALALSAPVWGLTNNGVSAPIQGVGVANTDCPAALANSSGGLGGTNGKAVATQLPNWASSADIDLGGTFTATWSIFGSADNVTYRSTTGVFSNNRTAANASTIAAVVSTSDIPVRYICVILTAYTSGTVVVSIEPRSNAPAAYGMLGSGSGTGGVTQSSGSAVNQASAITSSFSTLMTLAGDKSVVHAPAAATQASASIAGGGAAVRHIGTSCTVYISAVAAQPDIVINLRDGATGAGTILWTGRVTCAISSGDQCKAQSPPLNIVGSTNTAMTCETATAPAAGNIAVATLTYHDAG